MTQSTGHWPTPHPTIRRPTRSGSWSWTAIICLALAAFGLGLILVDAPDLAVALMFGSVLVAAYFAPTIVAVNRKHHNIGAIAVVNMFLGWTFLGWVVALAMAVSAVRTDLR